MPTRVLTVLSILSLSACTTPAVKGAVEKASEHRAPSSEAAQDQGELFANPLNRARHANAAQPWLTTDRNPDADWSDDSHFCNYFRSGEVDQLKITTPFFVQPGASVYIKDGVVHPEKPDEGSYCELRTRAIDSRNKTIEKTLKKELVNGHYPFSAEQSLPLEGCIRDREWSASTLSKGEAWVNIYVKDLTVDMLVCHPAIVEEKSGELTIGEFRSILKGLVAF